jgi:hypothetical protein
VQIGQLSTSLETLPAVVFDECWPTAGLRCGDPVNTDTAGTATIAPNSTANAVARIIIIAALPGRRAV